MSLRPGSLRDMLRHFSRHEMTPWRSQLREGRFQKHLAMATVLGAFFSGFEALYSHYKNNFRYAAQWTPVIDRARADGGGRSLDQKLRKPRARGFPRCRCWRSPMAGWDFSTMCAGFCAGPAD